ncbi:GumC family protein [Sphingomonas sp. NCPPB 2930]|uniref:GumC family protein n=1 Tax=unclassified Sphingomonas TaxID=196159 RepID=UPI002862667B|nr:polysaccharide biosynthesis tyrosine autokinase [Sphingomonas sp. SORGH_AS_0870]MDR6144212.1 succinoglycan biosynthesis transport protein ExoP [Sphingomonas sp. SORGH_AS_0870]
MNKIPAALGFGSGTTFEATRPQHEVAAVADVQPSIFRQYLRIAMRWRRYILGAIVACVLVGLIITFLMTPMYKAATTLEIARESNRIVNIQGVQQEASEGDQEFYQTQYGLLESRTLAERVAVRTGIVDDPTFFKTFSIKLTDAVTGPNGRFTAAGRAQRQRVAGAILLKHLDVVPARASRLVKISFSSPDPTLSAKIVNAWASNFIALSLERRYDASSYARRFLEERLNQLRKRLEDSERSLVAFASREKILELPGLGGGAGSRPLIAQDLADLNQELDRATASRIQAQAQFQEASKANGAVTEALTNGAINALRQRRAELAANYQRLMVQFTPDYPSAREIAVQIANIDQSIAREERRVSNSFGTALRTAASREDSLRRRVDTLKDGLLNLRRRSIQYNIYQREVDTNRSLYDGLLARYKEIGVASGIGVNNISVVDAAEVPQAPSSPRLLLNLLLSVIAGALIGAGIAYVLEQSDETITDPEEAERLIGMPLLGVIPKLKNGRPVQVLNDRKSELVDAYLAVATNLAFSTDTGVPATIAVTSTRPAEGKSTTALSLAVLLARSDKRVLLVDADMRSPSVHHVLDLPNKKGLSNYLAGDETGLDAILRSESFDMDVLTAGPVPPNAAELLTGPRFSNVLSLLGKRYDHIVIDSPPVVGLADAPLIASRSQAVLFTVESHGIRFTTVKIALGRLSAAHARTLGVVLTKFESDKAQYGQGYDYGYGYGEKLSDPA